MADALIGAAAASGLLWLVAEGYFRLRGREGMGLGDVKMMAMAGAFLGLQRALLTILLGSLLGSLIGVAVIAFRPQGTRFRAAVRHISGRGRDAGGFLRLARRWIGTARFWRCGRTMRSGSLLGIYCRQAPETPLGHDVGAGRALLLVVVLLGAAYLLLVALRRMLRPRAGAAPTNRPPRNPPTDNPAAFMTASMQAVIQKLREQEKELAALHRRDRERAQQTERLSEAVTRNMPAGLLLISSAGLDHQRQSGGGSGAGRACACLPALYRSVGRASRR